MPYIGHSPTQAGSFIQIDDFSSSFNGSTTGFTMQIGSVDITPNLNNLLVTIDGVLQHEEDAYAISGSTITFTSAPPSGASAYIILMGQSASVGQGTIGADELNVSGDGTSGQALISDGDGTFSWSTDAEPYLELAGGTMSGDINLASNAIINGGAIAGTFTGGLTGNASTATTLATARSINGVSFNGSSAITVTADANTLSNTTLKSTVVSSSLTSVGTLTALTVGANAPTSLGTACNIGHNSGSGHVASIYNGTDSSSASGLQVQGGYNASTFALRVKNAYNTDLLWVGGLGKVGIGTNAPLAMLDIKGDTDTWAGMAKIYLTDTSSNSARRNWSIGNGGSGYGDLSFIYSNSADGVPADSTGTVAMCIDNAGKVGIGTTVMNKDVNFAGSQGEENKLHFEAETDSWGIYSYDRTNGHYCDLHFGQHFHAKTGGNHGIGTTAPSAPLHVVKDSTVGDASTGAIRAGNATDVSGYVSIGYDDSADVGFIQSIDEGVAYKSLILNSLGGNVGIGATAPSMKLQIQESTHGANVGIRMYGENDAGTGQDAHIIFDPDAVFFGLSKGGSTIDLGINSSGYVGIGDSNPTFPLRVESDIAGVVTTCFENGRGGELVTSFRHSDGSNPYGFNIALTGATLNNTNTYYMHCGDSTGAKMICYNNGDIYTGTGTDIQTLSDQRLKENIQDYTGGLAIVNALQPRTYTWKEGFVEGKVGTRYGFVAQEIEATSGVLENMNLSSTVPVSKEDGDRYDGVIEDDTLHATQLSAKDAVLISAIKELTTRLEALENA